MLFVVAVNSDLRDWSGCNRRLSATVCGDISGTDPAVACGAMARFVQMMAFQALHHETRAETGK